MKLELTEGGIIRGATAPVISEEKPIEGGGEASQKAKGAASKAKAERSTVKGEPQGASLSGEVQGEPQKPTGSKREGAGAAAEDTGRGRRGYTADMPAAIYSFFRGYSEPGAPSLEKFAARVGITLEELTGWRGEAEFDRACRECAEIRRDMLIDAALTRRHDSSMTKFLLAAEFGMGERGEEQDGRLDIRLEVID